MHTHHGTMKLVFVAASPDFAIAHCTPLQSLREHGSARQVPAIVRGRSPAKRRDSGNGRSGLGRLLWVATIPQLGSARNNLGMLYTDQGKIDRAEALYRRAGRSSRKPWEQNIWMWRAL